MGKRFWVVLALFSLVGLILFSYLFFKKVSLEKASFPQYQSSTPLPSASLPSSSEVTLQPDSMAYSATDTIKITLANKSRDSIYFPDHQSNCTVVTIQRLVGKNWQDENQCALTSQPITFSLESNKSTVLELSPLPSGWVKGMYRAKMVVYVQNNKDHPSTILSPIFQIQ